MNPQAEARRRPALLKAQRAFDLELRHDRRVEQPPQDLVPLAVRKQNLLILFEPPDPWKVAVVLEARDGGLGEDESALEQQLRLVQGEAVAP